MTTGNDQLPVLYCLASEVCRASQGKEATMLYYALVFFIIAVIAAVLGFTGLAAGATGIAKVLFVVFLVMAIATFVVNLVRGR